MENNDRWVDDRMAALDAADFRPDAAHAMARWNELRGARTRPALRKWAVPLTIAIAAAAFAFPAPRAAAQRCVDACANFFAGASNPAALDPELSEYRGKVVLLNFWATWCPPCLKEMPWFTEFERKYSSRGFAAVGLSLDEAGWDAVKPFVSKHAPGYRIEIGTEAFTKAYGVTSLPDTFLIGRDGKVLARRTGAVEKEEIEREIEQALAR